MAGEGLSVAGGELNVEEYGSGEAVLLVHGAASSGRQFADVVTDPAAFGRMIVPDLRGMGRSPRVDDTMSPAVWVEDLVAVLDARGLESVHVIGVSLGSRVGARLALDHPERVRSLVVDAPIIATDPVAGGSLNRQFSDIADDSPAARNHAAHHGDDWRAVLEQYFRSRNEEQFQQTLDLSAELHRLDVPLLITRGDIDDLVHPLAHCFSWHKACPTSWLWIAPNTTASAVAGQVESFWTVYRQFRSTIN